MMTEFENTKSNLGKKVREAREEADNWKTQWEMMAEDNTKQRQRSGEEIQRLQGENRQLKSRYNLMFLNPYSAKKIMLLKMSSTEVVCCKQLPNITDELSIEANRVNPEQTAPIGEV